MILSEPERYKLLISEDSMSFSVQDERGSSKFSANASSRMPKLYVVSSHDIPIYVGVTTQPMRKRLQQGWSANGQRGYYGYQWRFASTEAAEVSLDVWCHLDAKKDTGLFGLPLSEAADMEILESEVVYLIRQTTGQWPIYQTEIHFHRSGLSHRRAALEIMRKYSVSLINLFQHGNLPPEIRVFDTGEVLHWDYDEEQCVEWPNIDLGKILQD